MAHQPPLGTRCLIIRPLIMCAAVGVIALVGACMQEDPQTSTAQQPAPPPTQVQPGAGSALGGAKRAAENVLSQAEEASRRTAEAAGSIMEDPVHADPAGAAPQ